MNQTLQSLSSPLSPPLLTKASTSTAPVAIVGGGLAGLFAATRLQQHGVPTVLIDRKLGGRATSRRYKDGTIFNQGAHALYGAGHAAQTLKALRIPYGGGQPTKGMVVTDEQGAHPMPVSLLSLLRCGAIPWGTKGAVARVFARIPAALDGETLTAWVERQSPHPGPRRLLHAIMQLSTYGGDPDHMPAALAVAQLQLAMKGVLYLDGGWQHMVDGLAEWLGLDDAKSPQVSKPGCVRWEKAHVQAITQGDDDSFTLSLSGERTLKASAVILATPPTIARSLTKSLPGLAIPEVPPIMAASLDLVMNGLPRPKVTFALGLDQPLYYSVHSEVAQLAPQGHHIVHVMKYLKPGAPAPDAGEVEKELRAYLSAVQPGYEDHVVRARLLPHIAVHHGSMRIDTPRPRAVTPSLPGLLLAGDWVDHRDGDEGTMAHLADAACASGLRAADAAIARWKERSTQRAVHL